MEKAEYTVRTAGFEGPLDLLLELVTKRKLFVNDISLASVTDDFISYLEEHEEFPISESAEFIVVASTLMLVKSRSLLPTIELSEEEEENIHDLEIRLAEYARFKELSAELGKIFGKKVIFEKTPSKNIQPVFSPDSKTDTENMLSALRSVLESLPKKEPVATAVVRKVASLEETIEKLAERIALASRMGFRDFYGKEMGVSGPLTQEKKISIIVGFLAMLELVKRGAIRVTQEGREIEMAKATEAE